jgi:predicted HTH transcriptional regulator
MKTNVNKIPIFEQELLQYIQEQMTERKQGFGITGLEYAKTFDPPINRSTARRKLDELVKLGKLQSKMMNDRGKTAKVYFK